jgi:hypothetical protein
VTLERPCPVGSKAVPQPLEAAAGTSIEDKMNFFSILLTRSYERAEPPRVAHIERAGIAVASPTM